MDGFGRIDVLVNNAGVTRRAYIMDLTEADWDRIMRVNAKGVFFCLQRVAREMIPRRSGAIINVASIAAKGYAGTSNAIYAASKGSVISLTRTAAQQLARHNINVNAICPGVTVTALSQANVALRAREEGRPGSVGVFTFMVFYSFRVGFSVQCWVWFSRCFGSEGSPAAPIQRNHRLAIPPFRRAR